MVGTRSLFRHLKLDELLVLLVRKGALPLVLLLVAVRRCWGVKYNILHFMLKRWSDSHKYLDILVKGWSLNFVLLLTFLVWVVSKVIGVLDANIVSVQYPTWFHDLSLVIFHITNLFTHCRINLSIFQNWFSSAEVRVFFICQISCKGPILLFDDNVWIYIHFYSIYIFKF